MRNSQNQKDTQWSPYLHRDQTVTFNCDALGTSQHYALQHSIIPFTLDLNCNCVCLPST